MAKEIITTIARLNETKALLGVPTLHRTTWHGYELSNREQPLELDLVLDTHIINAVTCLHMSFGQG